jgi:hypothetical protein
LSQLPIWPSHLTPGCVNHWQSRKISLALSQAVIMAPPASPTGWLKAEKFAIVTNARIV